MNLGSILRIGQSRRYFFLAACLEAVAWLFFWVAALFLLFFCVAFLVTDFGDLSPIIGYLSVFGFLASGMIRFAEAVEI